MNWNPEFEVIVEAFQRFLLSLKGYKLWDVDGKEYIDFFSGAGALNYGHNDEKMKQVLIDYLLEDGIIHSLDMGTSAKVNF